MDPSTEYKKNMTKKSKSLTHEQRRLKDRAGTIYADDVMGVTGYIHEGQARDWAGGDLEKKRSKRLSKRINRKGAFKSTIRQGKNPETGKPGGGGKESEY